MSEALLLGIDGGGTSTAAWLADAEGRVLGRGEAGPSNVKAVGTKAAFEALVASTSAAFAQSGRDRQPIEVACLGLAGFDRPEDRTVLEAWNREVFRAGRLILVNDGDLVVAAGTPEGWGIGLIAGTGSIAVGTGPDGRKSRAGGWGHVFGDEGSAYSVAIAGLRATAHRADGRLAPPASGADRLTARLCRSLGAAEPPRLITVVYGLGLDRAAIAGLAPAIVESALEGDPAAREILQAAAQGLAEMVEAAVRSTGLADVERLPLAMAGGFLLGCPMLRRMLFDKLAAAAPSRVVVPREVHDPVAGAIVLARRELERR